MAPALASPRNTRRGARRRLEKDVVEAEEDAARRARRRKSTRAAPKASAAADKAAAALNEEGTALALVPASVVATCGEQLSIRIQDVCSALVSIVLNILLLLMVIAYRVSASVLLSITL